MDNTTQQPLNRKWTGPIDNSEKSIMGETFHTNSHCKVVALDIAKWQL